MILFLVLVMLQKHVIFLIRFNFLSFFRSMQLEKRSLPTEEACHITMEVLQL